MAMKLYDNPTSPNSRKIRAVAREVDVTLDLIPVDLMSGGHKTPEFLRLNPNGKVPVLVDNDFVLWESNAILCYVATSRGPSPLLPTERRERALVDQWLMWQTAHLSVGIGKIMFERIYKARLNMGAPDPSAIEAGLAEAHRFSTVLDGVLKGREYVTGRLSVADFALTSAYAVREHAQLSVEAYPHIKAWLARMESRPSWIHAG